MNFIDKFLDVTAPLPRKIVRLLKLLKEVEEQSKKLKIKLQKEREEHIQKLKDNNFKNNESTSSLKSIEKQNKELLTLSDYKKEIIKEIKYILYIPSLFSLEVILLKNRLGRILRSVAYNFFQN